MQTLLYFSFVQMISGVDGKAIPSVDGEAILGADDEQQAGFEIFGAKSLTMFFLVGRKLLGEKSCKGN